MEAELQLEVQQLKEVYSSTWLASHFICSFAQNCSRIAFDIFYQTRMGPKILEVILGCQKIKYQTGPMRSHELCCP